MVRDDMKISSMTTECRRRNREEMERKGNNGGITQKRQGKPNHWEALHGRHCMGGTAWEALHGRHWALWSSC